MIAKKNDKVFVKEVLYKTGMTNRDIANHLKSLGLDDLLMYCDSAEPKSIEELKQMGILAKPAIKGAGSINAGIVFDEVNLTSMFPTKQPTSNPNK